MHFWPNFGNTDFNLWWLIARTSSKWGKFWLLSSVWPWSSRSIIPKNNRDLNQGLLHLWSKFGDSSLNGWWVTARTSWWLTDRHTHTHTHTQATTIPEGQNWPRVKTVYWGWKFSCFIYSHLYNKYLHLCWDSSAKKWNDTKTMWNPAFSFSKSSLVCAKSLWKKSMWKLQFSFNERQ